MGGIANSETAISSQQVGLVGSETIDQAMIEDNMMQKKPRRERAGSSPWSNSTLSDCSERMIFWPVNAWWHGQRDLTTPPPPFVLPSLPLIGCNWRLSQRWQRSDVLCGDAASYGPMFLSQQQAMAWTQIRLSALAQAETSGRRWTRSQIQKTSMIPDLYLPRVKFPCRGFEYAWVFRSNRMVRGWGTCRDSWSLVHRCGLWFCHKPVFFFLFLHLFAIVLVPLIKLKFWAKQRELQWLMLNKWRRLFHLSREMVSR